MQKSKGYFMNDTALIIGRFNQLEKKIENISTIKEDEIINREELCHRLKITEATCIKWEKRGKILSFRIGPNVRYNWPAVLAKLQEQEKEVVHA